MVIRLIMEPIVVSDTCLLCTNFTECVTGYCEERFVKERRQEIFLSVIIKIT